MIVIFFLLTEVSEGISARLASTGSCTEAQIPGLSDSSKGLICILGWVWGGFHLFVFGFVYQSILQRKCMLSRS